MVSDADGGGKERRLFGVGALALVNLLWTGGIDLLSRRRAPARGGEKGKKD
jgi:hypothetical protein